MSPTTHPNLTPTQTKLLEALLRPSGGSPRQPRDEPVRLDSLSRALARYLDELTIGNPRFGLIAKEDARDRDRLFIRHILDSIAPLEILREILREVAGEGSPARIYDLGSGAGLPGIPLALALAAVSDETAIAETVLVERRNKRVAFLRGVIPQVTGALRGASDEVRPGAVPTIRVAALDADNLGQTEGAGLRSSVVVFRAYQQTSPELLRSLGTNFPSGTQVCAWKGRRDQAAEEAEAITRSSWAMSGVLVHDLIVPGDGAERSMLVWRTCTPKDTVSDTASNGTAR